MSFACVVARLLPHPIPGHDLLVQLDAQARLLGHRNVAVDDREALLRSASGATLPARRSTRNSACSAGPPRSAARCADVDELPHDVTLAHRPWRRWTLTRVGGLTAVTDRLGLGGAAGVRQPLVQDGINIAASLHFVAALPNTHYFEYCVEQERCAPDADEAALPGHRRRRFGARGAGLGIELGRGGRGPVSGGVEAELYARNDIHEVTSDAAHPAGWHPK